MTEPKMEPTKEAVAIRRRLKAGRLMLTDLSRKLGISKAAVYERLSSNRKWRKPTLRAYRQALRALENGDNAPIDDSIDLSDAPTEIGVRCIDDDLASPMQRVDEIRGMMANGEGNSRPSDVEILGRIVNLEQQFRKDTDRKSTVLLSLIERIDKIERKMAAPKPGFLDALLGRR